MQSPGGDRPDSSPEPSPDSSATSSLRFALILRTLIPLFLVLGAATVLAIHTLEREIERGMEDDLELVARSLRLPIIHAMEREREGTVTEALRSALEIRRVYSAHIFGPEGEHVASFGAGVEDEAAQRVTDVAEAGEEVGEYGRAAGRRVYSYLIPLTDSWGRNLGLLQLTRRRADIDDSVGRLRLQAGALFVLGMGLVTVLVVRGHHRAVGHPLERLGRSMSRVRSGERAHRADPSGPKELAAVARTFNSMLSSMEEAEAQLDSRRRAQADLRRELVRAEKLAAVGELAGGVAHELGTPLSVIDGTAQRMLRDTDLSETARRAPEEVRSQVRRMEAIIRQLLDFGHRDSGRRREVRVADVVSGALAITSEEARRRGVDVDADGPRPGPKIHADPRRLEGAVANILENACHAADEADGPGQVRVRWDREGARTVIEVEDDGPGMSEEVSTRAFEPFFTTKRTGEGTGLGLAVVHAVVDGLGGSVQVDRGELGGSRLRVLLPCVDARRVEAPGA